MKKLLFLPIMLLIGSCTKETGTIYRAYLKNATSHTVQILPFKSGRIATSDTLRIKPNEELMIAEGWFRGNTGSQRPFYSDSFGYDNKDSILVFFDGIYSVSHYIKLPSTLPRKYLPRESDRNIYNYDNFVFTSIDTDKWSREVTHKFTFIEADYEFAKQ